MERQIVLAEYRVCSTFIIPEGIDLDNKDQVESWYIKYDRLTIVFKDTNEPTIKVCPYESAKEDDLKYTDQEILEIDEVDEEYKDEDYVSKTDSFEDNRNNSPPSDRQTR
jgi:hypothetical protein